MEEYILRLVHLGISTPKAWDICFRFFRDRDIDGLEKFIAKREAIEEVMDRVGLEKIQPKPHWA